MLKVALVHDQLSEFGGAERVLAVLHEMFPEAPIYTAYVRPGSAAQEYFKGAKICPSWAQRIPGFATSLASPLRFLAPVIWESFDFTGYDLVISSASWFITKGILTRPETVHISYIHTPPRYLWGLPTSVAWQKHWPVRVYGSVVNHYLREYDFVAAQRPDVMIANSENTRRRIEKFYHRDATVVYPPVELPSNSPAASDSTAAIYRVGRLTSTPTSASSLSGLSGAPASNLDNKRRLPTNGASIPSKWGSLVANGSSRDFAKSYFLVVSRVVGGKGLRLAVEACTRLRLPLVVVGEPAGWSGEAREIRRLAGPTVRFTGRVSDAELVQLYSQAKAFLATARDEDFGITPVEAMLAGTPVVAYRGGGYLETVVEGKTGVFFDEYSTLALCQALKTFNIQHSTFNIPAIKKHAKMFSKQRFIERMNKIIAEAMDGKSRIGK